MSLPSGNQGADFLELNKVVSFHSVLSPVHPPSLCTDSNSASDLSSLSPFANPLISFAQVTESELAGFTLLPEESAALGEAVSPKRRKDFSLGRMAARRALFDLGHTTPSPVLRGEHREPLFPKGITGSISHSGGIGIAAVAYDSYVAAVGVDIQQIEERYSDELIARFADPDEFDWVLSDPALKTLRAVKLFSAKESIFKALYPVARVWFAFDAAKLIPNENENGFRALVRLPIMSPGLIQLEISVKLTSDIVVTGAILEATEEGKRD